MARPRSILNALSARLVTTTVLMNARRMSSDSLVDHSANGPMPWIV